MKGFMRAPISLKKKSIIALSFYLCFFIAITGTVTYWIVEAPLRAELKQNLDLRAEVLSAQIREPLNRSIGVLQSIVSLGQAATNQAEQDRMLSSLFTILDDVVVSGGLWPKPYSINASQRYSSLFYNRAADGQVDKLHSWNNQEAHGYDNEEWYNAVKEKPVGSVVWSEVYVDAYTHVQMITASSPYYVNGEFAGVATVDLSLAGLATFIASQAELYNLGVSLSDSGGSLITEHNFIIREEANVSHFGFGDFEWRVDVINAHRLVNDEVFDLVMNVERSIIPILLVCVMIGYYLINQYVIKPITMIAKKVSDSKQGGIIDMPYRSQDEIRQLIDSFNQKTVYLEAEKVKAQASTQAKSAFLATLSHEIRTPMNGVLGTAQILLKTELSPEQRQHLNSLYESGEHMMVLLNEILDFSKIEQGRLELDNTRFPLDSLIGSINSVYHTLCNEKGLQFRIYSDIVHDRWYYSDKARLRQILFNLLNNAVKFTSHGFVEVTLKEQQMEDKRYLSIRIRDSGIGIAKEAQEKIFRPFEQAESSTTRRFGGTGLGLAIVKQIVELMDGTVTVTSELGIGTSFHVMLAIETTTPGTIEVKPRRKLNYQGLKALIVEDNRTNSIIIETFMKNKGFTCDCVENGELAIQAVVGGNYDLILMDNHMPVMDGVEAVSAIRILVGEQRNVLIFGCTADVFKETRERMLSAGADYIVTKPIDDNELDDALFQFVEKLYQYHPESSMPLKIGSAEESLVTFYMAVEDQNIELALAMIQRLVQQLPEIENTHIHQVLIDTQTSLEKHQLPTQQQVDLLTMLLSDFCN
ncbi:response regulator [Vibrio anguillarum]|uniref:hybrid sensor histidine kinase/response regulator n=1 Tax=Vibrio anguillarum TaxID=55601 RepID=UPI00188BE9E6|nr:hybrid sensor histidine kinase/response regulator [Vibrio anguillarum]MBF4256798.1 response regulator [Vibrio anguillarum]MBF4278181.1 response regulator [Vibrio anguillarum]MBF4298834.1 response regulator [Vibrio anguillarum]MBF4334893.1 response regulator [Vibrio anguillarum]MBF4362620.1 response regulator [Vibrio anguillarum]